MLLVIGSTTSRLARRFSLERHVQEEGTVQARFGFDGSGEEEGPVRQETVVPLLLGRACLLLLLWSIHWPQAHHHHLTITRDGRFFVGGWCLIGMIGGLSGLLIIGTIC